MEKTTIHILPELTYEMIENDTFYDRFMENMEFAETIDYIPDSIETLQSVYCSDIKYIMERNDKFFSAIVDLCADEIDKMIEEAKEESKSQRVQEVVTLEDLLNSGYYADDYEVSKDEFIFFFLEYHLYKIGKKKAKKRTQRAKKNN